MLNNPMTTCARLCVQSVGGLFAGENELLRLSDNARSVLDNIIPTQSGFALETLNNILQHWNVNGTKFEYMPEKHAEARRLIKLERSELEMTALERHSLPKTDFSLMLFDVGLVYGSIMFKVCGLPAWEEAGLLLVDTLYPDYWRSWSTYGDEWDAYEKAAQNATSLPDHAVELIKTSTIFNSCTSAIELRSNVAGYPSGIQDVINVLTYKSFESAGYGVAVIYAHMRDIHFETDKLVFAGWLVILSHDVFDYARDCNEENYNSSCMILHGLDEDGFSLGCAVLFAVWNRLNCFGEETARLFEFTISTSIAGNLSIPRYNGKEQLIQCTTNGEWSMDVKATALNVIKCMTGVSLNWPEDVSMTVISDATYADYHRTVVACLYESTADYLAALCIKWANDIINSLIRDRTIKYVKRESVQCGTWA